MSVKNEEDCLSAIMDSRFRMAAKLIVSWDSFRVIFPSITTNTYEEQESTIPFNEPEAYTGITETCKTPDSRCIAVQRYLDTRDEWKQSMSDSDILFP